MDPGVEQALLLLGRAGRMDLVNQEALRALRPARRAAQGVAAAVLACSPPTSPTREGQVGGRGRMIGRCRRKNLVPGAGRKSIRAAGLRGSLRGQGRAHKGGVKAVKARGIKMVVKGGTGSGNRRESGLVEGGARGSGREDRSMVISEAASTGEGSWGSGSPQGPEGPGAALLILESDSGSEQGGVGDLGQGETVDPTIPISKKMAHDVGMEHHG
ncbi:hypothetical protein NDU88_004472 [Pleurodeles waltl]|uniref:Uncharacterized protein n=1 Tax=Pleurodeles waltl TaxID=8319 RepID=A0AAV7N336_PLEWA|nr:hypothetical protein NDU88_004472 [Pleurodeles waltl]